MSTTSPSAAPRSDRLRALLAQDPGNASLALATATALYDEGDYVGSDTLLVPLAGTSRELDHLRGLVAMSLSRFDEAVAVFRELLATAQDDTIRHNLAYGLAMLDRSDEALGHLTDAVCAEIPAASALRVRLLHRLGRIDDAVAFGERRLAGGEDPALRGLLAMALFDQGDLQGAGVHAALGLTSAEGATTAGMLALEDGDDAEAQALFDDALGRNPHSGRALLGRGLVQTSRRDFGAAAETLEASARMLRTHSGAWVTAGWARLMGGEVEAAEIDFRTAMDLDRGFSEAAGGLAMSYLHRDMLAEATRYSDIALRLDPGSLTGGYVRSLLLAADGETQAARDRFAALLAQPIGGTGPSLGSALARRQASPRP